ncbi:hypothetical protein BDR04DRAFT_1096768 [Suillus decipiens]|nr:hypothetical protein BDR04DRAFT_1096768 [Suillus decipiens]
MGHPPAKTPEDSRDILSLVSRNVMATSGVLSYARVRRMKTSKGKRFWCIALACDDPSAAGEYPRTTGGKL